MKWPDPVPEIAVLAGGPGLTESQIDRLHPEDLADLLAKLKYDLIIIDCPPGNEHLERLGVTAASVALVVADAHPFAALGAGRVLDELQVARAKNRRGPTRWAVVMSRLDPRRTADRKMTDNFSESFPDAERLVVHQDIALSTATSTQSPLLWTMPVPPGRGIEDLGRIAKWCIAGTSKDWPPPPGKKHDH